MAQRLECFFGVGIAATFGWSIPAAATLGSIVGGIGGGITLLGALDKQRQAEAALGAALQQRQQVERESESLWRKERAEATEKRAAAEQEILKARKLRDLQTLAAPIDGTVTNLADWTVGGVVKPGDTLLNVVPLSATPENA